MADPGEDFVWNDTQIAARLASGTPGDFAGVLVAVAQRFNAAVSRWPADSDPLAVIGDLATALDVAADGLGAVTREAGRRLSTPTSCDIPAAKALALAQVDAAITALIRAAREWAA